MRIFETVDDIAEAVGLTVGSSEWVDIDQSRVDRFADATGDHQWIHVDAERAKGGPFGGTIAHGYLTLSMLPWLGSQIFSITVPAPRLNYGLNKVRFPAPVRVGSRIRATAAVKSVLQTAAGHQVTFEYTVEIEHGTKPACVAESIVLLLS